MGQAAAFQAARPADVTGYGGSAYAQTAYPGGRRDDQGAAGQRNDGVGGGATQLRSSDGTALLRNTTDVPAWLSSGCPMVTVSTHARMRGIPRRRFSS